MQKKVVGGIGFHKLEIFNEVIICKHVYRILSRLTSNVVGRLLRRRDSY